MEQMSGMGEHQLKLLQDVYVVFHFCLFFLEAESISSERYGKRKKPGNTNHDMLIVKMVVKKQQVFYLTFQFFCGWQCYSFIC